MLNPKRMGWPHAPWGTPPERRGAKPKFNWASVDWSGRDAHIARDLGCSRERVRQVRLIMGKMKPARGKAAQPKGRRK